MNKKGFIAEISIISIVIILLFLSLGINLQKNPDIKKQKNIEKANQSVGYTVGPVDNAPMITLTGEERADMCNLAAEQGGVQEDGSPGDGYTPYHRWAKGATQFGAQYGNKWYTDPNMYNYWCVLFVNWCAYTAGLDVWNNYAIKDTSNDAARATYKGMGRLSTDQNDSGLERGWISTHSGHMRIFVGGGKWVDGNSYDKSEPRYYYVSYNSRSRSGFVAWCKPYYRSKITYNLNGGSIANASNYAKYTEEKNFTLPTPTKSGNKFGGWYDNSSCTGTNYKTISSTERGLKKFWAKWGESKRNIYYYLNGGWWNGAAGASTFQVDKGYTIPKNVVKGNGSVFVNWYNSTSYTTAMSSIPVGHDSDVYLYARYKAPINYVTNGGAFSSSPSDWYTEGVGLTLPTNIYRLGCTFDGWFYDANFKSRVTNNVIPTSRTGSVTVYARWKATITFHSKIGAWKTAPTVTEATKTMTYYPGTGPSAPGISNGKNLYTSADLYYESGWSYFAGWYTGSKINTGTGPLYKIGDVTPLGVWPWTGNLNLYARWVGNDYKVYLHGVRGDLKNGSWAQFYKRAAHEYAHDYTYRYNNNQINLPPNAQLERRGHDFRGWYDNSSYYGSTYTKTDKRTGGDKHFYAKWEPRQYPVILYTYRGKVKDTTYKFTDVGEPGYWYMYDRKYTYSDDYGFKLPTQPATIDRRGHDFRGWYKNKDYTGTRYTEIPATTIDSQTFYARWTPKIYELKLNKEGGDVYNTRIDNGRVQGDTIVGTYTYGKGSTFPVANTDIEKKGAIFAGWYDNRNHTGNHHLGIRFGDDDTAPIGDKEYWARWITIEPNPSVSESNEVIKGELVSYIYQSSRISFISDTSILRSYDAAIKGKRKFGIKIDLDSKTASNDRTIKVWLSSSSNPKDKNAILNWTMSTNSQIKEYDSKEKCYKVQDNDTNITYTCPDNLAENYLLHIGGRKVFVHVETETGNTSYVTVNLVRRVVYQQH